MIPSTKAQEVVTENKDLPNLIARDIARFYYLNLEITLNDVKEVFSQYFPQGKKDDLQTRVDGQFIHRVLHTSLDEGKYYLTALLNDENLIRQAVDDLRKKYGIREEIKEKNFSPDQNMTYPSFPALKKEEGREGKIADRKTGFLSLMKRMWVRFFGKKPDEALSTDLLQSYKKRVGRIFDHYISWWKFSWFGHHHNKRAKVIKAQIQSSQSIDEIRDILEEQKNVLQGTRVERQSPTAVSARWKTHTSLKNVPRNVKTSGYYQAVDKALQQIPSGGH